MLGLCKQTAYACGVNDVEQLPDRVPFTTETDTRACLIAGARSRMLEWSPDLDDPPIRTGESPRQQTPGQPRAWLLVYVVMRCMADFSPEEPGMERVGGVVKLARHPVSARRR